MVHAAHLVACLGVLATTFAVPLLPDNAQNLQSLQTETGLDSPPQSFMNTPVPPTDATTSPAPAKEEGGKAEGGKKATAKKAKAKAKAHDHDARYRGSYRGKALLHLHNVLTGEKKKVPNLTGGQRGKKRYPKKKGNKRKNKQKSKKSKKAKNAKREVPWQFRALEERDFGLD